MRAGRRGSDASIPLLTPPLMAFFPQSDKLCDPGRFKAIAYYMK
jgi:hypothetical protein